MNVALRKVGNSQAVIIPKTILLQLGLSESLDMEVVNDKIILSKPKAVREGWAMAAQEIALAEDDKVLLDVFAESEDEWVW